MLVADPLWLHCGPEIFSPRVIIDLLFTIRGIVELVLTDKLKGGKSYGFHLNGRAANDKKDGQGFC